MEKVQKIAHEDTEEVRSTPALRKYTYSPVVYLHSGSTPAVRKYTCTPEVHLQSGNTPVVRKYTCTPEVHL